MSKKGRPSGKKWFAYLPDGEQKYPAYLPVRWQGWAVFVCFFAVFVGGPAALDYLFPASSEGVYILYIVINAIITTTLFYFIARKKS